MNPNHFIRQANWKGRGHLSVYGIKCKPNPQAIILSTYLYYQPSFKRILYSFTAVQCTKMSQAYLLNWKILH